MSDVLKARKRNKPIFVPCFLGSSVVVEFPGNLYLEILDKRNDNKVDCNNLAICIAVQKNSLNEKFCNPI